MLNTLETLIATLNDAIWGYILVYSNSDGVVFATAKVYSIYSLSPYGFVSPKAVINQAQRFRLSGTMYNTRGSVGTGNLAGVAVAITLGGPGAVFGCGLQHWLGWQQHLLNAALRNYTKSNKAMVHLKVAQLTT